jgi:hypothetical protein
MIIKVPTEITVKCSSERGRRFGGIYRLHLQTRIVNKVRNQQKQETREKPSPDINQSELEREL